MPLVSSSHQRATLTKTSKAPDSGELHRTKMTGVLLMLAMEIGSCINHNGRELAPGNATVTAASHSQSMHALGVAKTTAQHGTQECEDIRLQRREYGLE